MPTTAFVLVHDNYLIASQPPQTVSPRRRSLCRHKTHRKWSRRESLAAPYPHYRTRKRSGEEREPVSLFCTHEESEKCSPFPSAKPHQSTARPGWAPPRLKGSYLDEGFEESPDITRGGLKVQLSLGHQKAIWTEFCLSTLSCRNPLPPNTGFQPTKDSGSGKPGSIQVSSSGRFV